MKKKTGFHDLRISENQSLNVLHNIFEQHINLGYRTIALDTVIQESDFTVKAVEKGKAKQPLGQHAIVPIPLNIDRIANKFLDRLTILRRLTVHFSDADQLSRLIKEPNMTHFDLLAVIPSSELAFQMACSHPKVDIISFNYKEPLTRISRKHYYLAVERGICFEISYAPAISDRELRRNIIFLAHQYHSTGKSRNIVLTSGLMNLSDARGPYDVVNLGLLFGMSEEQSKAALTYTCRKLLIDAEARRAGRAVVLVKRSVLRRRDSSSEEEKEPSKRARNNPVSVA